MTRPTVLRASAFTAALALLCCAGGCRGKPTPAPASKEDPSTAAAKPVPAADAASPTTKGRDPRWAAALNKPGLPNFHRVSADLYRGAQPEPEGIAELKKLGVRTIVNLRLAHSDRDEIEEAGLDLAGGEIGRPSPRLRSASEASAKEVGYEHIKMEAWDADEDEIVRFLKVMADPARRPVFVHCKYGADRTGTMCAVYRIVFQGWTKEDAIREMRQGPFGFHEVWHELPEFIREMDVDALKREAGMAH